MKILNFKKSKKGLKLKEFYTWISFLCPPHVEDGNQNPSHKLCKIELKLRKLLSKGLNDMVQVKIKPRLCHDAQEFKPKQ